MAQFRSSLINPTGRFGPPVNTPAFLGTLMLILLFLTAVAIGPGVRCLPAEDKIDSPDRFSDKRQERERMVRTQLSGWSRTSITDQAVLDAMLKVPRHLFIPESHRMFAYQDTPVSIGHGQTISQPYIVALMTQALELKPGMKVLEVGTGSGYRRRFWKDYPLRVYN